jgi:hypothetical protein
MGPWIIFLAVASLLLLAVTYVKRGRASPRLEIPFVVIGFIVFAVFLRVIATRFDVYPDTWALHLAKNIERQLQSALADDSVQDIIFFEGSSYSARGLDGAMFGRLVGKKLNRNTRVVQMTLDGANHFERSWVLDTVLSRLDEEQWARLRSKHVTLMSEIQRGYDFDPLNGFIRNQGTLRTYAYMTPLNAVDGLRAVSSLGGLAVTSTAVLFPHVATHVLINAFSIGMAERGITFEEVAPAAGYQPLARSKRGFRFGGMRDVLAEARNPGVNGLAPPSWLDQVKLPRYRRIFSGALDDVGYYAVVSTESADLEYAEAFCRHHREELCLTYGDGALIRKLDRRSDWNDARHMRKSGAVKFTRWFARRYVRDVTRRTTP